MFYRDSWIEINIDNLKSNINKLRKISEKDFMGVIKANGYGNGDAIIAKSLIEAGVKMLAVSSLDEALALRKSNVEVDILILGYVNPIYLDICIENNLIVTLISKEWIDEAILNNCVNLRLHIKIDSGMNRLGLKNTQQTIDCLKKALINKINVEGIFTHFACSDCDDNVMSDKQYEKFKNIVQSLQYDFKWIHMANSDATIKYKEDFSNLVRCGIAMFGISSYQNNLLPVMSLYSKVINIKVVDENETVGYGATYSTSKKEIIATVPIGYADGWIRKHQGRYVLVNNKQCEIVGRVCMDQMMIKLDELVDVGSIVELIGENIKIEDVAKELDTIPYEVMTLLSDRLAKVYKEHGENILVTNPRLDRL